MNECKPSARSGSQRKRFSICGLLLPREGMAPRTLAKKQDIHSMPASQCQPANGLALLQFFSDAAWSSRESLSLRGNKHVELGVIARQQPNRSRSKLHGVRRLLRRSLSRGNDPFNAEGISLAPKKTSPRRGGFSLPILERYWTFQKKIGRLKPPLHKMRCLL